MNDTLSTKYYWRDWLVVVYPEMVGSKKHWFNAACGLDVTTIRLLHWNKRYNILVSSVPSDKIPEPFTVNAKIKTSYWKQGHHDPVQTWYDAKEIYESLPADAKKCKYPISGVVKSPKVAVRAPKNRRFQQKDEVIDIFVLG